MVIEMLLNSDIKKLKNSNDFTLLKKKSNYVHYWKKNEIKL
jgi:hypothetical protein